MYRHMTSQLTYETELNVSERQRDLIKSMDDGTMILLPASVFLRSNKRKTKEGFIAYRRSLRNSKKALRAYKLGGPASRVYLNKTTMEVI